MKKLLWDLLNRCIELFLGSAEWICAESASSYHVPVHVVVGMNWQLAEREFPGSVSLGKLITIDVNNLTI